MTTSRHIFSFYFRNGTLICFLVTVFLLSGCSSLFNDNDQTATYNSSSPDTWGQERSSHYAFIIDRTCFRPEGFYPAMVVVKADTVFSALNHTEPHDPIPIDSLSDQTDPSYSDFYPTIDDLFVLIEDARQRDADKLEVRYNDEFGYPEKIVIDYSTDMADDEISYTISGFSPIEEQFSTKSHDITDIIY